MKLATILVPAIATWFVVSRGDVGLSPDSLFYWSAARTIAEQRMVATQVSPQDYARTVGDGRTRPDPGTRGSDGAILYPLTTWPPAYPIALAALTPLGRGSTLGAARILAVITLVLLVAAFATVASQLVDPPRAVCAAALVACLPFVHASIRMVWSDAMFAALALTALGLLAWAFSPAGRPGLALALTAVTIAAATYVRYTGVLAAGAAVVAGVIVARRIPGRPGFLVKAARAVGLYGLLVAPLFARNFSLAGALSGAEHAPAGESGVWLLAALVTAFARGVVPWVGTAVPGPRDALVTAGASLAAWAVAGTAVIITARQGGEKRRPSLPLMQRPMGVILIVFVALYSATLFGLRTMWHFDFNTRMLLPAVASLALLLVCMLETRLADRQVWAVNRIALVAIPLVTIASFAAADRYLPWRGYNSPVLSDRPVAQWARAALTHAGPGTRLRFLSVGYFIPYLSFETGGAGVGGLPDVPAPRALLAHSPYTATVVILEPGGRRFQCPEYQRAYEGVLGGAADSTFQGEGFTAWWLSAASVLRLERSARDFAPSCH